MSPPSVRCDSINISWAPPLHWALQVWEPEPDRESTSNDPFSQWAPRPWGSTRCAHNAAWGELWKRQVREQRWPRARRGEWIPLGDGAEEAGEAPGGIWQLSWDLYNEHSSSMRLGLWWAGKVSGRCYTVWETTEPWHTMTFEEWMHTREEALEEMNVEEQEGSEHKGLYTELDPGGQERARGGWSGHLNRSNQWPRWEIPPR